MTRYSVQPGDKKNLKYYEFLSFSKIWSRTLVKIWVKTLVEIVVKA